MFDSLAAVQAIRVEQKRPVELRWVQHAALLTALATLFGWGLAVRSQVVPLPAEHAAIGFLAPPSAPAQVWQPVRVPVRTSVTPDPTLAASTGVPAAGDLLAGLTTLPDGSTVNAITGAPQWVQAHRRAPLLTAPEEGAARELEVPQWSYLRVLATANGWLRVAYGAEADGRPANVAWVSVADIGASGPPPQFVMARADLALWDSADASSARLSTAPGLATMQLAGLEKNGRLAVQLDGSAAPAIAWVDREAVSGALDPLARDVPLAQTYSPFRADVRLDVPYRTQLDGSLSALSNCGPTSVAMVLEAFGISIPTAAARSLALLQMGISSPFSGTTLESLRSVAEGQGLVGLGLHENGRYHRWTLEEVRQHIRAGQPIIPQLRYRMMPGRGWTWTSTDHYVVISGVVGDDFIIDDPIPEGGHGERLIRADELDRAWRSSDYPYAGFAVARPE